MAEINSSSPKSGKTRSKGRSRSSGHIDMTAMVDVAFLLLTFFVLTSVIKKDVVMQMTSPPMEEEGPIYTEKDELEIMTLVLDSADRIQYYVGMTQAEPQPCTYGEVRGIIQDFIHQNHPLCRETKSANGAEAQDCWDPYFLIKAKPASSFRNLVDILDEMAISDAPKYTLDKLNETDLEILAQN